MILPRQKKRIKRLETNFLCFRTKTAHIEQLLFDPIGPFSYVLSHIFLRVISFTYMLLPPHIKNAFTQ